MCCAVLFPQCVGWHGALPMPHTIAGVSFCQCVAIVYSLHNSDWNNQSYHPNTMAKTNQNAEAQAHPGSQPQQGDTMAQSQERRKRTTQRKKPGHWRKQAQPTIDGSIPFDSSMVCRAEALGPRKPKRAHHVKCPRNTRTRGKEICEQSIKVQKAMEHNLKVNAVQPTGWHNPTAEEFKSFFAMRRGTTTRNNSTCSEEQASIRGSNVVDPFQQLYKAVKTAMCDTQAFVRSVGRTFENRKKNAPLPIVAVANEITRDRATS